MGWQLEQDAKDIMMLGVDAVSAYACGGSCTGRQPSCPEQYVLIRHDGWEEWRAPRIPGGAFASGGWETRPRIDRPASWMPGITSTPAELAAHLREAVEWTRCKRDINPSPAIISFGWNEHEEGVWLAPTWTSGGKSDTARLAAVRSVLELGRPISK
jgi:hypothetical protein